MFCINCGKEIDDGSKFCDYCGEPTENTVLEDNRFVTDNPNSWANNREYSNQRPPSKGSKFLLIIIGIVTFLIIVTFAIIWLVVLPKHSEESISKSDQVVKEDTRKERESGREKETTIPAEEEPAAEEPAIEEPVAEEPIAEQESGSMHIDEQMSNSVTVYPFQTTGTPPGTIFSYGMEASSTLKEEGYNYNVMNLYDFNDETCWVEGVPGYGIGQSIEFKPGANPERDYFNSLAIKPGFCKSEERFLDNGFPAKITVWIGDIEIPVDLSAYAYDYESCSDFLIIDFGQDYSTDLRCWVGIDEVREGRKHQDTCISMMFFTW